MERKKKVCSECGEETYLYARKRCLSCDRKLSPEKHGLQTKPNKAPQGTNSSEKGKCTLIKRKSRISPVSKSMTKKLAEYRVVRDEYLRIHTTCEAKVRGVCTHSPVELHHLKPRAYHLCDTDVFMSVCRQCHSWIESHDEEARSLGLKFNHLFD